MHEDDVKSFEDMDRDELIAAATFWRSEYERVASNSFVLYPKCAKCGGWHDPSWTCAPMPGGGFVLQIGTNQSS